MSKRTVRDSMKQRGPVTPPGIAVGSRWRVVRGYAKDRALIVIDGGNENYVRYQFTDNHRSTCRNLPTFLSDMVQEHEPRWPRRMPRPT